MASSPHQIHHLQHPVYAHSNSRARVCYRSVVLGGWGAERMTGRDREITCTVLVNVAVFMFACFPLLAVGSWMMFLYFTQQVRERERERERENNIH